MMRRAAGRLQARAVRWFHEHKPRGWLSSEERALVPPRRLWIGPGDPIGHYYRGVWEYLAYLTVLLELRREEAVLELGCGHGRTAHGLLYYLRHPGRYVGLDVDRRGIEDAQSRISARYPNFQFVWTNVRSRVYNPLGEVDAADVVFPVEAASFDAAYAASLFTHLLPAEALNYLRQTRHALRDGGRCLFSFFVLDHYRGPGTSVSPLYEFDSPLAGHSGVAVHEADRPDAAIAYSLDAIDDLCARTGWHVDRVIPGLWSESPGLAAHEQDLVVLSAT